MSERKFVLFKTELFVFRQPDEDVDQWFVGGDCAGWFYARLLPTDQIRPGCEPVMEDWGWTFAVEVNGIRVWVNVWAYFDVENCWLFGIEAKRGLFGRPSNEDRQSAEMVVGRALDGILSGDVRFSKYEWLSENAFDLGIREF